MAHVGGGAGCSMTCGMEQATRIYFAERNGDGDSEPVGLQRLRRPAGGGAAVAGFGGVGGVGAAADDVVFGVAFLGAGGIGRVGRAGLCRRGLRRTRGCCRACRRGPSCWGAFWPQGWGLPPELRRTRRLCPGRRWCRRCSRRWSCRRGRRTPTGLRSADGRRGRIA